MKVLVGINDGLEDGEIVDDLVLPEGVLGVVVKVGLGLEHAVGSVGHEAHDLAVVGGVGQEADGAVVLLEAVAVTHHL